MSLESLLRPVKYVDEQVHQQSEKLGSKLDQKSSKARYYVSGGLALSGFSGLNIFSHSLTGFTSLVLGGLVGISLWTNIFGYQGRLKSQKDTADLTLEEENPVPKICSEINNLARLPLLAVGVGYLSKGLYDLVNGFMGGGSDNSYDTLVTGASILGLSLSMYSSDRK